MENKGVPAVPSAPDPFPLSGESYFSGGYNTGRHGSRSGGNIDGIQIECHQDIRFDSDIREMFADSLIKAINEFIDINYLDQYLGNYCNLSTNISSINPKQTIEIFPNPTTHFLNIKSDLDEIEVAFYNFFGQKVSAQNWSGSPIDISFLRNGSYFIELKYEGLLLETKMIIKQ